VYKCCYYHCLVTAVLQHLPQLVYMCVSVCCKHASASIARSTTNTAAAECLLLMMMLFVSPRTFEAAHIKKVTCPLLTVSIHVTVRSERAVCCCCLRVQFATATTTVAAMPPIRLNVCDTRSAMATAGVLCAAVLNDKQLSQQ
jgi:hypothetical protein